MNGSAKTHLVYGSLGGRKRPDETRPSLTAICRSVGPVVYYIRTSDDLIKIGFTRNLLSRHANFGGWERVLAITPGTYADEQELHDRFRAYVARGKEYYHPVPPILDHIDEIRDSLGVPPLTRV